jgi:metal-sulfur cluster biosynthetic enzyme
MRESRRSLAKFASEGDRAMREGEPSEFPAGAVGAAIRERLARVLDPELDEPVLDLGFVRSVRLAGGCAEAALRLPTSWCAVNFAYLMAEDVRRALLSAPGVRSAVVSLGDHCAAREIEAAVNGGQPFAEAFPGEGGGSLAELRLIFLRKGFFVRQQRLLQALRAAGCAPEAICALSLSEVPIADDADEVLRRYLERRAELGLDCNPAAPLIVDLDGAPVSPARLAAHYEAARTMRVALEANGSFCRALLSRGEFAAGRSSANAIRGGTNVPS